MGILLELILPFLVERPFFYREMSPFRFPRIRFENIIIFYAYRQINYNSSERMWFSIRSSLNRWTILQNDDNNCFICFIRSHTDSHILACEEEWRRLAQSAAESRLMSPGMQGLTAQQLRTPTTPLGAPLILSPRMSVPTTAASLLSASAPPTIEHPGLIYATPYGDYTNYAALTGNPLLTEYADHSGGLFAR